MILSELIAFLKSIDARPKKSLSQNFLVDANIVRKIVQKAEIKPGDRVLEIGPGPGALTKALLEAGAQVIAIEKDTLFATELPRLQTLDKRLAVFEDDFLKFDLERLARFQPCKIVANLPYHITAPILEKIFDQAERFSCLTIMVQKEVAVRMASKEGSKDFGSLSLFVQFYSEAAGSFVVPASCFYPAPKVDSTVIRLIFRPVPSVPAEPFFKLVRKAFQQRRKMVSTSLSPFLSTEGIKAALRSIGSSPEARPETLSLTQWIKFYYSIQETIP
jgi:16S rRNA (adenine1518-N6/adenine1519-N6)-dimethyltransferase